MFFASCEVGGFSAYHDTVAHEEVTYGSQTSDS